MIKNGKVYRLTAVFDRKGDRLVDADDERKVFYGKLEGSAIWNLQEDYDSYDIHPAIRGDIIQDREGKWIRKNIRIRYVEEIRELENGGVEIVTVDSVFRFEAVKPERTDVHSVAGTIELFLNDENDQFAVGFYHDADGYVVPLRDVIHLGLRNDFVQLERLDTPGVIQCKYFPKGDSVEFYTKLFGHAEYASRFVVHNAGKSTLKIYFERNPEIWTIQPGETRRLTLGRSDGVMAMACGEE